MEKEEISLEEYKRILTNILIEIDKFCRANNISYFLTGGTLIGAVRHKGFIPWDDDIDLSMMRDDYDFFVEHFRSDNKNIKVLSLSNDSKYIYPFAKIVDDRIGLIEDVPGAVEIGPYIDLFPIDSYPGRTYNDAKRFFNKVQRLKWLRNFKIIRFSKKRKFYKNVILFFGKMLTLFISRRKIAEKIEKVAIKHRNENGKYIGVIVNATYGYGEILDRTLFDSTVELEFEDNTFEAPIGYDKILTSLYGDYMTLPPVEKRVTHHSFKCWYK